MLEINVISEGDGGQREKQLLPVAFALFLAVSTVLEFA